MSVTLTSLSKSYDGRVQVLDGLEHPHPHRRVRGLLGASGCGKSTLLNLSPASRPPTGGSHRGARRRRRP